MKSNKIDCKCLCSKRGAGNAVGQKKGLCPQKEDSSKGPQVDEHTERQKWTMNVHAQTRMRHYRPKGAFAQKGLSSRVTKKRQPTEGNEQTKHTLAQCSERYHKLRKSHRSEEGIHRKKS